MRRPRNREVIYFALLDGDPFEHEEKLKPVLDFARTTEGSTEGTIHPSLGQRPRNCCGE